MDLALQSLTKDYGSFKSLHRNSPALIYESIQKREAGVDLYLRILLRVKKGQKQKIIKIADFLIIFVSHCRVFEKAYQMCVREFNNRGCFSKLANVSQFIEELDRARRQFYILRICYILRIFESVIENKHVCQIVCYICRIWRVKDIKERIPYILCRCKSPQERI